jgi:hypothetical protein
MLKPHSEQGGNGMKKPPGRNAKRSDDKDATGAESYGVLCIPSFLGPAP